jgi:hypothetical protein
VHAQCLRVTALGRGLSQGYGGPEFLFSRTGVFPRYIDSHVRPLKLVQEKLGLRALSHHKLGRHSIASQAVTSGESVKAVQAQLGHRSEQSTHKYSHLGAGAQKRLVEVLKPAAAPHEIARDAHVNGASTNGEGSQLADALGNVASTASPASVPLAAPEPPIVCGANGAWEDLCQRPKDAWKAAFPHTERVAARTA